jgi:hypothetical protein
MLNANRESEMCDPKDAWLKSTLGLDPAKYKTYKQADGAAAVMRPAGTDKQAAAFEADFRRAIDPVDGHLKFLADHAEAKDFAAQVKRRDVSVGIYNFAQTMVDPADDTKADKFIKEAMADITGTGNEVAACRQTVEKAFNEWTTREKELEAAHGRAAEMEKWGHAKGPDLHKQLDGVQDLVDARQYSDACGTFDKLVPDEAAAYDDYTKQKAAQATYDAALDTLKTRLTTAAAPTFKTLEPDQQKLADQQSQMEAAATAKDYVGALEQQTRLDASTTGYETKLADLQAKKDTFEKARDDIQESMRKHSDTTYKKLDAMRSDIRTANDKMDESATAEDFDAALTASEQLKPMIDVYNQDADKLDAARTAFETAANADKDHLATYDANVTQSTYKQLVSAQEQVEDARKEIGPAVEAEEYETALMHQTELETALAAYDKALSDLQKAKQAFADGRAALQKKLDTVGNPDHPKLHDEAAALLQAVAPMDAAAAADDYEQAMEQMTDLDNRADAYARSVQALEDARLAFVPLFSKALTRVQDVGARYEKAKEPMPGQIELLRAEIEKLSLAEEYGQGTNKLDELNKELDALEQKLPDDKLGSADDETKKVQESISLVTTRVETRLNAHHQGASEAIAEFKTRSVHEIDALVGDPSAVTDPIAAIVSAMGAAIALVFPPATGVVIAATFGSTMVINQIKREAGKLKDVMKIGMEEFARNAGNAISKAIDAEAKNTPTRLTNLAASDNDLWKLLSSPMGEREYDRAMTILNIPDPSRNSLYGPVLKALMGEFGAWLAKEKALSGKTKGERMVAEGLPGEPSAKDLRKQTDEGRRSGVDQGTQLGRDRQP